MKQRVLFLLFAAVLAPSAQAAQADQIRASHPWIRLLPVNLPAGGYVTLDNGGADAVTLVSVQSDAYGTVMLHQSSTDRAGHSSMHVLDRLIIPAHGQALLAPAGSHLMLERAAHALHPGETVELTLTFADGSHLQVPFLIRPANAAE